MPPSTKELECLENLKEWEAALEFVELLEQEGGGETESPETGLRLASGGG